MNKTLLLSLALALPAMAGTTSKQVVSEPAPPPSEWNPFIGTSVGYLFAFEEPLFSAHVGVDTPWTLAGFDVSFFLEGGYTKKEENLDLDFDNEPTPQLTAGVIGGDYGDGDYEEGEDFEDFIANIDDLEASLEIIPVTFNVKFERAITSNLGFYIGAGVGIAFTELAVEGSGIKVVEEDTVFAAQAFAGLVYNVTQNFEVYGGARYLYIDTQQPEYFGYDVVDTVSELADSDFDFESDVSLELGIRYTF